MLYPTADSIQPQVLFYWVQALPNKVAIECCQSLYMLAGGV